MNHVFSGSIPEMGDEGRIPPALTGAGDKLNEEWIKTVLAEGAKDRPYMATRMPRSFTASATLRIAMFSAALPLPGVSWLTSANACRADAKRPARR